MTSPKILVAGATGTNGRELLSQLTERNIPARATVRDAEKAKDLVNDSVELAQADLADKASLIDAMQGIEKAYIVTAIHRDAPVWFEHFFAAAKQAGVKHVIKFSGMGASMESDSEIIRQHAQSDQALIDSGLTYTILRPNSFYQNMLWQADAIKHTNQFYLPLADAKQSLVDVRDIAEATVNILTQEGHDNRIYDITGPESLSFSDVAAILSEQLKRPITYVPVPVEAAKQAMLEQGMPQWDANAVAEIQGVFATGKYADPNDDLATLLGRKPTSFRQFAQDFISKFK